MFLESICSGALLKVVVGRVTREAGTSEPLFHDFLALLKTPGKQNPTALLFTSTYTQLYHLVWSTKMANPISYWYILQSLFEVIPCFKANLASKNTSCTHNTVVALVDLLT
jgi:hypothetical protein